MSSSSRLVAILLLIVVIGGLLRIVGLPDAPPGLNQDEAANAWNAWCLLKTGTDQTGRPWPIFYTRCHGGNSSTLFIYWMIPFQAIGGLNVWTTRLPAAVAGVLTLPLLYFVGARMFGRSVGLIAAALLALSPWHIQQCRWGHEASIIPMLVCGTLAMMLWAGLPFDDDDTRRPRPLLAALAGLAAGVSCYGYQAVRLFLPAFMVLCVLVTWRSWRRQFATGQGRAAILLMLGCGLLVFGPLAYKHVTDGDQISKQLKYSHAWKDGDPPAAKALSVARRYASHFTMDFLFLSGDRYRVQAPPGTGQLDLYLLPLILIGGGAAVRAAMRSRAARILLVWLAAFPIGDCMSSHFLGGAHALRSLPGLPTFMILAAIGTTIGFAWLHRQLPGLAVSTAVLVGIAAAGFNARFVYRFFGEFSHSPAMYSAFQADLLEACRWLKADGRHDRADAVFFTTKGMNEPYVITLIAWNYDPAQWLRDKPDVIEAGNWDHYRRYGKIHFVYDEAATRVLLEMMHNNRQELAYFVARPNEPGPSRVAHVVIGPDGKETLRILEQQL